MECGGIIYLKSGVNNYLGVFIMLKKIMECGGIIYIKSGVNNYFI